MGWVSFFICAPQNVYQRALIGKIFSQKVVQIINQGYFWHEKIWANYNIEHNVFDI